MGRALAIAVLGLSVASCGPNPVPRNQLPPKVVGLLESADHVELISLKPSSDPDPRPKSAPAETFHGEAVLGRTTMTGAEGRQATLKALRLGMDQSDGKAESRFEPRHGLRVRDGESTLEAVISFQCSSMFLYMDGERWLVTTDDSPETVFNRILVAAGIPLE